MTVGSMMTRAAAGSASKLPAFRSSIATGTTAAATTSVAPSWSSTTRIGDVILATVALNGVNDTIATPAGWTKLFGPIDSTGTGTNMRAYLFAFTATANGTGSVTFTKTGTSNGWKAVLSLWSGTAGVGATASNPLAAAADTAPIILPITPTVDRSLLVGLVCNRATVTDTTFPAHFVEVFDTNSGNAGTAVARLGPLAVGVATGTATATANATTKWVTFAVEVKHA